MTNLRKAIRKQRKTKREKNAFKEWNQKREDKQDVYSQYA